ncbi:hypothetical protein [Kribbella sp. DT2]|uniref:hypothetical protein n=1 Tax=Kribbella sp. DT2 TaxID=3393427 RepID=UPI003CEF8C7D
MTADTHTPDDTIAGCAKDCTGFLHAISSCECSDDCQPCIDHEAAEEAKRAEREANPPAKPALSVVRDEPEPDPFAGFWDQRESLSHLRDFARARMASPWAVLGAVMGRATCSVPPSTTLPPIVGGEASLNLFVALVGRSGGGKGAAESAARDAINFGDLEVATLGSGEGIMHLYSQYGTDEQGNKGPQRIRDSVLFTAPEIDQMAALGGRQSSTLMPTLRSAWSGERLGFSYANREKALPLEAHTYRLGLVVGVQPARAFALLDESDGGTPQRFVWLPTEDPEATGDVPDAPPARDLRAAGRWLTGPLKLPEVIWETIRANRLATLRGETEALDGHSLLCREKVAVALCIIDGRRVVTEDDWDVAGQVMAKSDETRTAVQKVLNDEKTKLSEARGVAAGVQQVVTDEFVHDRTLDRIGKNVLRVIRQQGGELAGAALRRTIAHRDRDLLDDALTKLGLAGKLTRRQDRDPFGQTTTHYRLPQ